MNDTIGIIGYLRGKKSVVIIAVMLLFGVCLMLFGGGELSKEKSASIEERVEALCERTLGASDISVMVMTGVDGEVCGVAVVCRGGEDASVRLTLTEMLTALFGIPSSRVSVVGGK